ncbi:coiled-coil domain-containing protein 43 isoform 2, partial [Daubentonia madagascariensis]
GGAQRSGRGCGRLWRWRKRRLWVVARRSIGGAGSGPSRLRRLHPGCPAGRGGRRKAGRSTGYPLCFLDEVQAIATLIEKQAQIVVKPRMVSEEEKQRKAALLAQYADVTDEEDSVPKHQCGRCPQ